MSSLFYKTQNISSVRNGRYFVVGALQESLARYVRQKMDEQNLSTHAVARRTGGAITHATVHSVLNAEGKDIKVGTLIALAQGLRVSEDELFAAARGKPVAGTKHEAQQLVSYYEEMSSIARRHFELIGETLWRESKGQAEGETRTVPVFRVNEHEQPKEVKEVKKRKRTG